MSISAARRILKKAEKALIAALDGYNKPDNPYREETFSILTLNAWELLLKAKLVQTASNDIRCLYIYESRTRKDGTKTRKQFLKKNRTGNPHTIGLQETIAELENRHGIQIDTAIKANINALTEIRDNAIHYMNAGPGLTKTVLEVGTAAFRNFLELAREWFNIDLSHYRLYLLPIGFISTRGAATIVDIGTNEQRVVDFLTQTVAEHDQEGGRYHVALEVNLSIKRVSSRSVAQVQITRDPSAPKVQLSEEDIRQQYPWDYNRLTHKLRDRYVDFIVNKKYHDIRKPLKADPQYVRVRFLDPGNPRSARKEYYSPNIIDVFDRHYTRK